MIGVMSDSHDNRKAIKEAVRLFNEVGCELVIHAGDFVAPFAALELANLTCQVKAVFGNCDGEKQGLERAVQQFGEIQEAPFIFKWKETQYLLTHKDFPLNSYLKQYDLDILIFGHTHRPEVRFQGNTLLLNPGEAGGWVTGKETVAILDPVGKTADIITLPK
jgi:putative phosphoesterase